MKEKRKIGGGVLKGLIDTGGNVVDKALEKGADVAVHMTTSMTGLISKLSDDIGAMANRILTMEERMGLMADRIVRTEELMASLTATLADKKLAVPFEGSPEEEGFQPGILSAPGTEATENDAPHLVITGNPGSYLFYVSTNPLFRDGSTVVTQVTNSGEHEAAWSRSIRALRELSVEGQEMGAEALVVAVAVRVFSRHRVGAGLSNSIDVTVHDFA